MIKGKHDEYPTLSEILQAFNSLFNKVENFLNSKQGFFFIFSAKKTEGSRGPYYDCTLGDSKKRVEAKVWISEPGLLEPRPGYIALADYLYDEKFGISLKIKKNFSIEEMEAYSAGSTAQLLPIIPDIERVKAEVSEMIETVENAFLRKLLERLIGNNGSCGEFFEAPAAKVYHHALIGGLAKHSLNVAKYALAIYEISPSKDSIDRNLIVAASLLHDLGKAKTYSRDDYSFDYTDIGQLEDHIAIGVRLIDREIGAIDGFPELLASELLHIVLSHHGELQFGSPVAPKTREALIIHHCDNLDAKLDHFDSLVSGTPSGDLWTEFSRMFQGRLYTGNLRTDKDS